MTATRSDVNRWIEIAKKNGDEYIISVCDTYDWDDYPVFCKTKEILLESYEEYAYGRNMQKVNEIIRINKDGTITENLHISNI